MRFLPILLILLISGCGYHVPGSSETWVGGETRILFVKLVDNQTAKPFLENYMTNALVSELSKSRVVELTEDRLQSNVRLVGEVKSFQSEVLAYGTTDRIADYRATMTVAMRLLHNDNDKILWQSTLKRSEDYPAAVNKTLQLEGERLAAEQVAQRLAEDVSASILNSF